MSNHSSNSTRNDFNDDSTPPLEGLFSLLSEFSLLNSTVVSSEDQTKVEPPPQQSHEAAPLEADGFPGAASDTQPPVAENFLQEVQNLQEQIAELSSAPEDSLLTSQLSAILRQTQPNLEEESIQRLQNVLYDAVIPNDRQIISKLAENLANLERKIYDPNELIVLLLPLIAELISLKIVESKEEVVQAVFPIIDQVIQEKSQKDRAAMGRAFAAIIPTAISQQIQDSPEEIAKAIGPTMGKAIKEQVTLEGDAMVDALYPVIGNTISKYMAEAVRDINAKVENALSVEGVSRKIRAKVQGVSEAELILKESFPFSIQAIFLIHKTSGLVISEVQPGSQQLESDMVGGMLTAIRSFANEFIGHSGNASELTEIEYASFKIILEVAGYCYIAVVTQGETPKVFIEQLRHTLSSIIQLYGKPIEYFDGDRATIPEQVHQRLETLISTASEAVKQKDPKTKNKPPALLVIGLGILLAVGGWGIYQYRLRRLEAKAASALSSTPALAIYRLGVDVRGNTLELQGLLPNEELRQKAGEVALSAVPKLRLDNQIIAVEVPPDPVLIAEEVQRLTTVLSQLEGVEIFATYADNRVRVEGKANQALEVNDVVQAFEQIPGVRSVIVTLNAQKLPIDNRIYFDKDSTALRTSEIKGKISSIEQFLAQYPETQLAIIGHADGIGSAASNEQLAKQRAFVVKNTLVQQGIAPERLQVTWSGQPPPDVDTPESIWLARCVRFERLLPSKK
ncbi:MAG: OmpA family protein [Kastovskya adunca ATA6-11-RM4]|jgi:outer membrane protein OmpA-like peptidoglycan-associated protein|nr:OmpA family protein [Kastovskya adunca ATA6-11-RM4]